MRNIGTCKPAIKRDLQRRRQQNHQQLHANAKPIYLRPSFTRMYKCVYQNNSILISMLNKIALIKNCFVLQFFIKSANANLVCCCFQIILNLEKDNSWTSSMISCAFSDLIIALIIYNFCTISQSNSHVF